MNAFGRNLRIAALAAACALATAQCAKPAPRKPNVVIIAIDTLRPDHLGCYGSARATSPAIDAWAKDAVVFERAMSASPWTAPSLLSLMTSLYPSVHGVAHFPSPGQMNERVTTLAEVLKQHGYLTGAFTDGGYAKKQFGLGQGFDVYPLNAGDTPEEHASNLVEPSRLPSNIERTLAWLERVGDADPFFLFFHTYEVHGPYRPPAADVVRFRPDYDEAQEHGRLADVLKLWREKREITEVGLRLVLGHVEHCLGFNDPQLAGLHDKLREYGISSLDAGRMQFWRDLYDGEIRHTDRELQRLLERLDRPGVREHTLVVLVSDHGEGFGEHGNVGHGSVLHDEDLRVVLMLRAPGVAPRRVGEVVRSIDVMPTLLDLAGIAGEGRKLQGRSLTPLLHGLPFATEPSFSHALSRPGLEGLLWSVRENNWRYVWNEQALAGQLFDLSADPLELLDVAADNPKVAERLLGLLRAQRAIDAAFLAQASGPVGPWTIDAETKSELEALGYLDGGAQHPAPLGPALPPPTYDGR